MKKIDLYFPCTIIILVVCFCQYCLQLVLNTFGGISVWLIIFFATFVVIFSRNRVSMRYSSYFGINRILFYALYFIVFSMGASSLVQVSFLGFYLPKQIYGLIFFVIIIETILRIVSRATEDEKDKYERILLFIFITVALGNMIVVFLNPSLAKTEAADGGIFVLGYSMAYTLSLLIPTCIYNLEQRNKKSKAYLFLLIVVIISVFMASYFIAITAVIISAIIYFAIKKKNTLLSLLLIVLTGVLVVYISSGEIDRMIYALAKHVSNFKIQERLLQLANFSEMGLSHVSNADTTYRFVLYSKTWLNFLKHPLLGNFIFGNYSCFFDHATFLDMLSTGGVLLGGLYFFYLKNNYISSKKFLLDNNAKNALLATYLTYFYLALFNSVFSYNLIGLLTVLPILLRKGTEYENFDISSL